MKQFIAGLMIGILVTGALSRAAEITQSSTTMTNALPEKSPCELELDKIRKAVRP